MDSKINRKLVLVGIVILILAVVYYLLKIDNKSSKEKFFFPETTNIISSTNEVTEDITTTVPSTTMVADEITTTVPSTTMVTDEITTTVPLTTVVTDEITTTVPSITMVTDEITTTVPSITKPLPTNTFPGGYSIYDEDSWMKILGNTVSDYLTLKTMIGSGGPGTYIHQSEYDGVTNIFSPLIIKHENQKSKFENMYDSDNYYHL